MKLRKIENINHVIRDVNQKSSLHALGRYDTECDVCNNLSIVGFLRVEL